MTVELASTYGVGVERVRALAGNQLDLHALAATVLRGWRLILAVAVPVAIAVWIITDHITPLYDSVATFRIDPRRSPAVRFSASELYLPADDHVVETEVQVLRSPDLVRDVVRHLKLGRYPEYNPGLARGGPSSPEPVVLNEVTDNFNIAREYGTYLVSVGFRSEDSALAAAGANAMVDAYMQRAIEARAHQAAVRAEGFSGALTKLSDDMTRTAAEAAQYRGRAGLVRGGNNGTITDQQIAPTSEMLSALEAQAASRRAELAAARTQVATGGVEASGVALSSTTVQALRSQRAQLEAQRAALTSRYGPKHPEVEQVEQQLAQVRRNLNIESQRALTALAADSAAIDRSVASMRANLERLRAEQATAAHDAVTASSLDRRADALRTTYSHVASAAKRNDQDELARDAQASWVEAAKPQQIATTPNKPLFKLMGILLGGLGGIAVVLFRESLRGRVLDPAQIEGLGVPVPASIARRRRREEGMTDDDREALRALRAALFRARSEGGVVAIASALPSEGKSATAAGLAATMAAAGDRVILVDADLRRSGLSLMLGPGGGDGLATALGQHDIAAALARSIVTDPVTQADYLPAGSDGDDAAELWSPRAVASLLDALRARYDRVVVDLPPLLAVSDAVTVAAQADGVVLVAREGATPLAAYAAAIARLERAGAPAPVALLSHRRRNLVHASVAWLRRALGRSTGHRMQWAG